MTDLVGGILFILFKTFHCCLKTKNLLPNLRNWVMLSWKERDERVSWDFSFLLFKPFLQFVWISPVIDRYKDYLHRRFTRPGLNWNKWKKWFEGSLFKTTKILLIFENVCSSQLIGIKLFERSIFLRFHVIKNPEMEDPVKALLSPVFRFLNFEGNV